MGTISNACIYSYSDIHSCLLEEKSVQDVFEKSKEYLATINNNPNELLSILSLFWCYNLPCDSIQDFVNQNLSKDVVKSIVDDNSSEWKEIGIMPEDCLRNYIGGNLCDLLLWHSLKTLPDGITPETFLEKYSLSEIKKKLSDTVLFDTFSDSLYYCDACAKEPFEVFVENYLDSGGSLEILISKYLTEIGYRGDPCDMLILIKYSPNSFDMREYVTQVRAKSMSGYRFQNIVDTLRNLGVEEDMIGVLYRYE